MKKSRKYDDMRSQFHDLGRDDQIRFIIDVVTDAAKNFKENDFRKTQDNLHESAKTIFHAAERIAEKLRKATEDVRQAYEADFTVVTPKKRRTSARRTTTKKSGTRSRTAQSRAGKKTRAKKT